jgi:outer membrane protein assembly factor BamA
MCPEAPSSRAGKVSLRAALVIRSLSAALCTAVFVTPLFAQDSPPQPQPGPVLNDLVVQNATVFTRDDVLWLLGLRIGERLPGSPEDMADLLRRRYGHEGYTAVAVESSFDSQAGRLTLAVREGRIDEIEVVGVPADQAQSFKEDLAEHDVREGDVYNRRTVGTAIELLLESAEGAFRLGGSPEDLELVDRAGRHVLVIPLRRERGRFSFTTGTGAREDLFNPVDGFSPGVGFHGTVFDRTGANYTFLSAYVSYRFAAEDTGYSFGIERPLLNKPRLFVGAEAHDLTATDDLWRLSTVEQSLVSFGFKNTFRDYYRRRGTQLHAGVRPGVNQEFLASWRWDTHEPLRNETNFSVFRDRQTYRPNTGIARGELNALVLAYTFDSRGLGDGIAAGFERHLADDLFRGTRRQAYGWRIDWTSEIAGHGTGGDYTFDRHILNARAYVPMLARQSLAARVVAGFSRGALPIERRFAIGGVGTVHGYGFKEASGARMTLLNAEYRVGLTGDRRDGAGPSLRAVFFFDAGRVDKPITSSRTEWMTGIGGGLQIGPLRFEAGYRLNDIPRSRQILVRLGPTF